MQYKAPLRDIQFVMHELLDSESHYKTLPAFQEADRELMDSLFEMAASFAETELSPLNQSGDAEGCKFDNGKVTTPKGFKEAYKQYCELGFPALSAEEEFGGQNMPFSLSTVINEMVGTANWSFSMYPGLSHGAIQTIEHHGTDEQKQTYLEKMVTGEWSGTMCLTEAHAGSDLGIIRTKAEPNDDGTYSITGQKIFISAGEHDLTDNIIHIVLARLPGAPAGTKGISLFIVPKVLVNEDNSLGENNNVVCGSIEHKMGIKASATCVMNFDSAKGYLIGPENRGLQCMFTFMNVARIGTAVQGLTAAEYAFQGSLTYAKDRLAMRSLSGAKAPEKVADPIIVHPAVRNMLLTEKAFAEGGRSMIYHSARYADKMAQGIVNGDEEEFEKWDDKLGFYTPILKGFLTEPGIEAAKHGQQIYGGHGYIKEWGMELIARDARIATMYEGTTGVQALDLLGRKVILQSKGKIIRDYTSSIMKWCGEYALDKDMRKFVWALTKLCAEWNTLTVRLMLMARKDREIISAASDDFLMYSGYVMMGYHWARMAAVAYDKLENGGTEAPEFYKAKIQTAEFYFDKLLPRTSGHAESMVAPSNSMTEMDSENFAFLD